MRSLPLVLLFIAVAYAATPVHAQIFVDAGAVGGNDGTSWADAYTDLQDALAAATAGDVIWVAAGTYKPTPGTDRTVSFVLPDSVGVYGGFLGNETNLSQRNYVLNETILSGDIGAAADSSDNSYHVVDGTNTSSMTALDGFTVEWGNATAYSISYGAYGGGILVWYGLPIVRNVVCRHNHATYRGGGMYYAAADPVQLTNLRFEDNSSGWGGGLYAGGPHQTGPLTFTGITCTNNLAERGGGCYATTSTGGGTLFEYVHFEGNTAQYGGGIHGYYSEVRFGDFTGNTATVQGGAAFQDNGGMDLHDLTLEGNDAPDGGGVYVGCCGGTYSSIDFLGNAATGGGGAFYVERGPVEVDSSYFHGNHAVQGGAVYVKNEPAESNPSVFTACNIDSNTADVGGGMWSEGLVDLESSVFSRNAATNDGGAFQVAIRTHNLANVLLVDNTAGDKGGAAFQYQCEATWVNCTSSGNLATDRGGAMFNEGCSPTIVNTVLWGDSAGTDGAEIYNNFPVPGSVPVISYSDIEGCGGSGGGWDTAFGTDAGKNLDQDPLFADAVGGDYRLAAGSPVVENGDNSAPGLPATDLDGGPRIRGVYVDMGVYESQYFCPATPVLYVDETSPPGGNGASWSQAYPTIEDALAMFEQCGGIEEIYGSFAGTESSVGERALDDHPTVLSGEVGGSQREDNLYHVVTASGTDSSAVLDGFVITRGYAIDAPTTYGGGTYVAGGAATLRNLVWVDNYAEYGGALSNDLGDVTVVNAAFVANYAQESGGAFHTALGTTEMTNATFTGNTTQFDFYAGSGLYLGPYSNTTIHNSILWGNGPSDLISSYLATPIFDHSIVEGSGGSSSWDTAFGTDGGGNLDEDPLFVDALAGDVHLGVGSPAIDAGDDGAPLIATLDLGGDPRISGAAVDMGAYEYQVMTAVEDAAPYERAFRGAYPNPFNPEVTLAFELDRARRVSVKVYDVAGRLVRTLVDGHRSAGPHRVVWDGLDSSGRMGASGVYFVRVTSEGWSDSRKIVLLK
jgi:hypothetical protein